MQPAHPVVELVLHLLLWSWYLPGDGVAKCIPARPGATEISQRPRSRRALALAG